jgi:hypothetical protein
VSVQPSTQRLPADAIEAGRLGMYLGLPAERFTKLRRPELVEPVARKWDVKPTKVPATDSIAGR